jgi:hypothetical protein
MDAAGRVDRFNKRYAKKTTGAAGVTAEAAPAAEAVADKA